MCRLANPLMRAKEFPHKVSNEAQIRGCIRGRGCLILENDTDEKDIET